MSRDHGRVQPLRCLAPGESGRIVHITAGDAGRLRRLSMLGVVRGAIVHLQQTRPAAVIRVAETTVALEPEIADQIHVCRTTGD